MRIIQADQRAGQAGTKVYVDNTPDLGDFTGEALLNNIEQAVHECRGLLNQGYRLTSFWTDPDKGIEFVLRQSPGSGAKGQHG
ncbi:hypothetical protein [Desulfoscipio gibsoniae]|uniref:hypothetical protein n=1 Tax=Desulfoscipio gibsoniae TaxID=102134 RepID=UPI001FDF6B8E|nr:hypothetical protein [Desulfoscipio gibsoniae]